jgi:hypothetical protein
VWVVSEGTRETDIQFEGEGDTGNEFKEDIESNVIRYSPKYFVILFLKENGTWQVRFTIVSVFGPHSSTVGDGNAP